MMARRYESGVRVRPGCSARPATARLRRACAGPILVRPSIRATQPWGFLQPDAKRFRGPAHRFAHSQEPHTEPQNLFPLEPRAKTVKL